ncbi:MAG TPA: DUF3343 domain-containing protein [Spirochaetota bacterium]|nr:DUF3343 domain-containing protein [Spirochaetota bacterium]HOD16855.1 DUF3343 domain-containing protein [Spirochaetota bacterium]HPG50406.1 DUF3343 domain-containing protein [Spirochaetota bacterium]HPN13044.1 DUF3343 domain-containing protein [Spirochaetota bacterium]HQL83673.1 DUF3343 domain-containing protein [Spirochaetota bacterium]
MSHSSSYHVILFKSVNQTMWADKLLREKGIPHKLVPVPRTISSDCGVCIRIKSEIVDAVRPDVEKIDGFTGIVRI